MVLWKIGEFHPLYGKVASMNMIEGEPYRFFVDEDGSISMIPLDALKLNLDIPVPKCFGTNEFYHTNAICKSCQYKEGCGKVEPKRRTHHYKYRRRNKG